MNELKRQVERGEITIRYAAYKLFRWGKVNFIPNDTLTLKILHITL